MVSNDTAYVEPADFDKTAWVKAPLENKGNILQIGGISTLELAEKYGTPVYVTDEDRIRENYQRLKAAFTKVYPKTKIHYAIKCNNNMAIVKLLEQEGACFDCSSPYEIQMAQKLGATPDRILYLSLIHI